MVHKTYFIDDQGRTLRVISHGPASLALILDNGEAVYLPQRHDPPDESGLQRLSRDARGNLSGGSA